MTLLRYLGPELQLTWPPVAAAELSIEEYEYGPDGQAVLRAKGSFTGIDYVEHGIRFTDPWEAVGVGKEGERNWLIRCANTETAFWREADSEEPAFTASPVINDAIKGFITGIVGPYEMLAPVEIVMNSPEFVGERVEYGGLCVCDLFRVGHIGSAQRARMLRGGRFPESCFACSCGTRWWQPDSNRRFWAVVDDDEAWQGLLKYNGKPPRLLGFLEGKVYNLQTLCNRGLIPIG